MTHDANPTPHYAEHLLELVRDDLQLQALMPIASVHDALRQPGLSYERLISTVLDSYAERPGARRAGVRDCRGPRRLGSSGAATSRASRRSPMRSCTGV